MTHPYAWHDSFTRVTLLPQSCGNNCPACAMTHSRVTWRIHTCDMTGSRVWLVWFTSTTWLMHVSIQRTTHCNTLQHPATHCNTLQHTATHCNTLQHTATHCNTLQHTARHCNMRDACMTDAQGKSRMHTSPAPTHCNNTLQRTARHYNILLDTATYVTHASRMCDSYTRLVCTEALHSQCVAVCCSVLQCVAVCCSELQWVAVSCSEL